MSGEAAKEVLLLGGGGHCRSVIDVLRTTDFRPGAILDRDRSLTDILGVPVLGDDSLLAGLRSRYAYALVTVGQIKNAATRRRLYGQLVAAGYALPVVISARASVSPWATVGAGTVVMHFATVNANARIGENCILNTGCIVEHDATVGATCHVSTGAVVNGGATVEDEVFVGSGALLRENVRIGAGSIVGMGARIFHDIAPGSLVATRPAEEAPRGAVAGPVR